MTYADDLNAKIMEAGNLITEAVGNGSASVSKGTDGFGHVTQGILAFRDSRVHALQELDNLMSGLSSLLRLFEADVSPEIDRAISLLKITKQKVEDYSNVISLQIQDLEALAVAMEGNVTNLISSSGIQMQQAVQELVAYINRI